MSALFVIFWILGSWELSQRKCWDWKWWITDNIMSHKVVPHRNRQYHARVTMRSTNNQCRGFAFFSDNMPTMVYFSPCGYLIHWCHWVSHMYVNVRRPKVTLHIKDKRVTQSEKISQQPRKALYLPPHDHNEITAGIRKQKGRYCSPQDTHWMISQNHVQVESWNWWKPAWVDCPICLLWYTKQETLRIPLSKAVESIV